MKVLICLGNQILAEGVRRIVEDNFTDVFVGDFCSEPPMRDPDLVLFNSREKLTELKQTYDNSRFICLDLGLNEAELSCLLLYHEISGIISPNLSVEMFCKALKTVYEGEIWVDQTHLKAILHQGRGVAHIEELRRLSAKDKQIIRLVAQGLRNSEIAEQLCLSVATVKAHLSRIYKTLNVDNRSQLVALATVSGWQITVQ